MKQNKETEQTTMDVADEKDTSRERRRFPVNIHMILLSAIVLIIGFSVFRLYLWDKGGERIEYDPNQQTTDFDVEVLDSIIPLAPDKREGYVDDGVTTILCLGDDPFSLDQGEGGLAEQIAQKTGATVYNGSFTGTTMAPASATFGEGDMMDAFSFLYVATSLAHNDLP